MSERNVTNDCNQTTCVTDLEITPDIRQSMTERIVEAVAACGAPTTKTPAEMENHLYFRANNRNEYMSFVARLIFHIKEIGQKITAIALAAEEDAIQTLITAFREQTLSSPSEASGE